MKRTASGVIQALDPRKPSGPLAVFHRRARRRVPWLQTLVVALFVPLVSLAARVRVSGRENIPDGGYIVAANHPSVLDPLLVALAVRRRIRFMGKSELFSGRWGGLFSRLGGFPVMRGVWDADSFATAIEVLERGRVLAIFPEGGVKVEKGEAKGGAGHIAHTTGATVLPVRIQGSRVLYKPRPWRWPVVRVTIGAPIMVVHDAAPTRERSLATAVEILDEIYAIG